MKSECKSIIKTTSHKSKSLRLNGSSSVLVIMIMLLLITFGVLAMMSSYSNLKIAQKKAEWTKDYYQLESISEEGVSHFKVYFENALTELIQMSELDQLNPDFLAQLPEELSTAIIEDPLTLKRDVQKWAELETDLFFHILNQKVNQLKSDSVNLSYSDRVFDFVFIDLDTSRQMRVSIQVNISQNTIKDTDYEIIQWREVPADFVYEVPLEFGDPKGE